MKEECEMCGDEPYKEVETPDGIVTMCKGCHDSYIGFCGDDKYLKAIAYLSDLLDSMIYIPFKKKIEDVSNFGFIKEKFKLEIEKTINNLKEE